MYQRQILQGDRIIRRPMHPVHCHVRVGGVTRACTRVHRRSAWAMQNARQTEVRERVGNEMTGRRRHEEEEEKKKPFMYSLTCSRRRRD